MGPATGITAASVIEGQMLWMFPAWQVANRSGMSLEQLRKEEGEEQSKARACHAARLQTRARVQLVSRTPDIPPLTFIRASRKIDVLAGCYRSVSFDHV